MPSMTEFFAAIYFIIGIATAIAFYQPGSWHQSQTSTGEMLFMICCWPIVWMLIGVMGFCAFVSHVYGRLRNVR